LGFWEINSSITKRERECYDINNVLISGIGSLTTFSVDPNYMQESCSSHLIFDIAFLLVIVVLFIIVRGGSPTEAWSVVAKTARESTLPEHIDEGQEEPPQNFPYGQKRHPYNCFGWSIEPMLFGGILFFWFLRLISHATPQTAETSAGGQSQSHSHGHVADIYRQHERELC
jgi:hypothetical protein